MAIVTTNPLVSGLSGMLGRSLVFKNLGGKTIVASRPRPAKTESEQQRKNRSKFRLASAWAKTALLDPQKKSYYQQKAKKLKLPNAYTAAIADYMRKPQLKEICRCDHQMTYVVYKKDFELQSGELRLLPDNGTGNEIKLMPNRWGELVFTLNDKLLSDGWHLNAQGKAGSQTIIRIPATILHC